MLAMSSHSSDSDVEFLGESAPKHLHGSSSSTSRPGGGDLPLAHLLLRPSTATSAPTPTTLQPVNSRDFYHAHTAAGHNSSRGGRAGPFPAGRGTEPPNHWHSNSHSFVGGHHGPAGHGRGGGQSARGGHASLGPQNGGGHEANHGFGSSQRGGPGHHQQQSSPFTAIRGGRSDFYGAFAGRGGPVHRGNSSSARGGPFASAHLRSSPFHGNHPSAGSSSLAPAAPTAFDLTQSQSLALLRTNPDAIDVDDAMGHVAIADDSEGVPNSAAATMGGGIFDDPLLNARPIAPPARANAAGPLSMRPNESSMGAAESGASPVGGLIENYDPNQIKVTLHNRDDPNSPLYSVSRFEDLGLPSELLRGLYSLNYNKPSKIQERALPLLLHDPPTNLIAQSQSGTGKTAAFALTMLKRLDLADTTGLPQAVCLVNARELAIQVLDVVRSMGMHMTGMQVELLTAGTPPPPRGTHILVGTPGRILDLAQRRRINLSHIRVLVLDEADTLLDGQNLMQQTVSLKHMVNPNAQTVLFSATFPDRVTKFADQFAPNANKITLPLAEVRVDAIMQFALHMPTPGLHAKLAALSDIYGLLNVGQSLVFVDRKDTAYRVAEMMKNEDHEVSVLTGEDLPGVRDQTMKKFREGLTKVLVSTNVLARGIDVPQVNLVVNLDLPKHAYTGGPDFEAYIHRVGRTGRFGRAGVAINFIDGPEAERIMESIRLHYGGMTIHHMPNDDFEGMERLLKSVQVL